MNSDELRSPYADVDLDALPIDVDRCREELSGEAWACARLLLAAIAAHGEGRDVAPDGAPTVPDGADPRALMRAVGAIHREIGRAAAEDVEPSELAALREGVARASATLVEGLVGQRVQPWREMLRDVSHDIRSPLNSILFLTDGLYNEHSGPLDPGQRQQLGIVYSAAASLHNLVNDLLDFARKGENEVRSREVAFALPAATDEIRRLVAPLVDHYGADFKVELETRGRRRGDPQLVTRIAVNLISNAVEAGGRDGEVLLRIEDAAPDPEPGGGGDPDQAGLRLIVEDSGPGLDPEEVRPLLERRPDHEVTRMLRGRTRGLGLVICGRLARSADGTIDVERRPGGGTRFTVSLPFRAIS